MRGSIRPGAYPRRSRRVKPVPAAVDPAAQLAQVIEDHGAGELGVQAEVPGEEPDAAADRQAVGVGVQPAATPNPTWAG
jgi:hypothetical protein